jgi:large subunit ribosomal protein L10
LSLNLEEKKAVVAEVSEQVSQAQAIVFAEYRGLQVGHMTQLRVQARKSGVYLRVLKNTLVRRAVDGTPFSALAPQMVGPLVFGISADPVAAAKVLHDFAKANDKFVILGGGMGRTTLNPEGVKALATLPSLDELRAKLVGMINQPAAKLATVISAPGSSLARVVKARAEKEDQAA